MIRPRTPNGAETRREVGTAGACDLGLQGDEGQESRQDTEALQEAMAAPRVTEGSPAPGPLHAPFPLLAVPFPGLTRRVREALADHSYDPLNQVCCPLEQLPPPCMSYNGRFNDYSCPQTRKEPP